MAEEGGQNGRRAAWQKKSQAYLRTFDLAPKLVCQVQLRVSVAVDLPNRTKNLSACRECRRQDATPDPELHASATTTVALEGAHGARAVLFLEAGCSLFHMPARAKAKEDVSC